MQMHKFMTIAALAAGLATMGASAQAGIIINGGSGAGAYTLDFTESDAPSVVTTGDTTYTYVVTLLTGPSNVKVTSIAFGNIEGYDFNASSSGAFGGGTIIGEDLSNGTVTFTATGADGLTFSNNTAAFSFDSNYPVGKSIVTVGGAAKNSNGGFAGGVVGPTAPTPEPGSLTVLGLGALSLGLLARRARRA